MEGPCPHPTDSTRAPNKPGQLKGQSQSWEVKAHPTLAVSAEVSGGRKVPTSPRWTEAHIPSVSDGGRGAEHACSPHGAGPDTKHSATGQAPTNMPASTLSLSGTPSSPTVGGRYPADTGCAPRRVTDTGPQSSPGISVPLHGPEPVARARTALLLATAWPFGRPAQLPQSRGQRQMLLREPGNNLAIKSSDHGEKTTCVLTSARLPRFSWPLTCPIRWPEEQSCSPGAASRPEGTWVQGRSGLTQPWSQPAQPQTSRRQGAAAEAGRQQEPLGLTGQRRPAAICRPANRGGGGRAATGWPRSGPGAPHSQL